MKEILKYLLSLILMIGGVFFVFKGLSAIYPPLAWIILGAYVAAVGYYASQQNK